MSRDSPSALERLHREVDARAQALAETLAPRLQCRRGCSGCCVDDITVFEVEAERIVVHHASLLAEGEPHPRGACAFLDREGACRIYADRPYVCRTQGLPLRWYEDDEIGDQIEERRDICPLNAEGPPLESLPEEQTWLIGPTEERLAAIQQEGRGTRRRVALRDLFRAESAPAPPSRAPE